MADLIDRQAAIDAMIKAFDRETLLNSLVRKVAVDAVKALPSVDAVEVVRCINCKLFQEDKFDKFGFCSLFCDGRNDDDFCSKAVRK